MDRRRKKAKEDLQVPTFCPLNVAETYGRFLYGQHCEIVKEENRAVLFSPLSFSPMRYFLFLNSRTGS
jgi:hypothetical protein